jgi:hypothetical protein
MGNFYSWTARCGTKRYWIISFGRWRSANAACFVFGSKNWIINIIITTLLKAYKLRHRVCFTEFAFQHYRHKKCFKKVLLNSVAANCASLRWKYGKGDDVGRCPQFRVADRFRFLRYLLLQKHKSRPPQRWHRARPHFTTFETISLFPGMRLFIFVVYICL